MSSKLLTTGAPAGTPACMKDSLGAACCAAAFWQCLLVSMASSSQAGSCSFSTEAKLVLPLPAESVVSAIMLCDATQKLDPSAVVSSPSVSFLLLLRSAKFKPWTLAAGKLPLLLPVLRLRRLRVLLLLPVRRVLPLICSKSEMGLRLPRSMGGVPVAPRAPSSALTSVALLSSGEIPLIVMLAADIQQWMTNNVSTYEHVNWVLFLQSNAEATATHCTSDCMLHRAPLAHGLQMHTGVPHQSHVHAIVHEMLLVVP